MPQGKKLRVNPDAMTIEEQMFLKRTEEFNKDLAVLQNKHNLVIVPFLNVTTFGILPDMKFMDKTEFEAKTRIGQQMQQQSSGGDIITKKG